MSDRKYIFENALIRKTRREETKEARLNRRHPIIIAMMIALVASIVGGVLSTLIIDQLHYHNNIGEENEIIEYVSVEKAIEDNAKNGTNSKLKVNVENSLVSKLFGEDEIELGILLRTFTGMSIGAYFSLIVSHLFLQEKFKSKTQAFVSVMFGVIATLCICGIGMFCFDLLQL